MDGSMAPDAQTCSLLSSHGKRRDAARKALLLFPGKYFLWILSAIRRWPLSIFF